MSIKKLIIAVPLILILLLSGCGYDKIIVDSPLSEDEIIAYAQKQIYEETGDTVTVEIVSKKQLRVPTAWMDGPIAYQNVTDGTEYELKIINDKIGFEASGTYKDAYYVYDRQQYPNGAENDAAFYHNYTDRKGHYDVKAEFINALDERFDKYYIYDDVSTDDGLDVFVCSTDFEKIEGMINDLEDITFRYKERHYVTYSVYIYTDENAFNSTDFEKYKTGHEDYSGQSFGEHMISNYTGKAVTKISYCKSFDKAIFESYGATDAKTGSNGESLDSYDYIVFWYSAEPNSFSGKSGPGVYIYGVK